MDLEERIKAMRMPLSITAVAAIAFLIFQNGTCAPNTKNPEETVQLYSVGSDSEKQKPTPVPLRLFSSGSTVMKGEGIQLKVDGGTPPFRYYVLSGGGTLSQADGWYVANTEVGTKVEVMVQDGTGGTAQHTLSVTETRCEPSEKQNCEFHYSGHNPHHQHGTPNLHCRITYFAPETNFAVAKELEYYTSCGTCREGAFGGRAEAKTHVEAPISVVTSIDQMMICKGKPGFGEPKPPLHSYKVETLSDSSCPLHDQYITYSNCVPFR